MKTIVGIMGSNNATEDDLKNAFEIGKYLAEKGFVVLTGGVNLGVQNEALKGAKSANGLTVGILPFSDKEKFSKYVDIPIVSNMMSGRNYLNVLTSNLVIACGSDVGTVSEIALSLVNENKKKVVIVGANKETNNLFKKLRETEVNIAKDFKECFKIIEKLEF